MSSEDIDNKMSNLLNAYLIVDNQVFPLTQAITNIGRRLTNHLAINDARVSRTHAQIRTIKGRYLIVDLNSTGGTYVNGEKIDQAILYSGDPISLAGFPLVFVQEHTKILEETEAFTSHLEKVKQQKISSKENTEPTGNRKVT
jgi:pSer/pThr/pTyr-binding forkhead associated (FHA) protein